MDYLDPDNVMVHHRLYRDDCVSLEGVHVKDLRVIANRDLADIVLIDNAAYSFAYQVDNGIPIISWVDDRNDLELYNLIDYLKRISLCEDVRVLNRQTFRLHEFCENFGATLK